MHIRLFGKVRRNLRQPQLTNNLNAEMFLFHRVLEMTIPTNTVPLFTSCNRHQQWQMFCFETARKGGKAWDTMKPLYPFFKDLSKVLLFDDDSYKACEGEETNMVVIPSWKTQYRDDDFLVHLVNVLLEMEESLRTGDVRMFSKTIKEVLQERARFDGEADHVEGRDPPHHKVQVQAHRHPSRGQHSRTSDRW